VVLKSIFIWDMTRCSALSGTGRFGGTYRLHLQGCRIVSEAASKQVATQRTTRRHIPEEDTLQNHRCENLKSYIFNLNAKIIQTRSQEKYHVQRMEGSRMPKVILT
jgi:hypothetical protein